MKTGPFEINQKTAQSCPQEETDRLRNPSEEIRAAPHNAVSSEVIVRTTMGEAPGTQAIRLLDSNDGRQISATEISALSENIQSGTSLYVDSAVTKASGSQALVVSGNADLALAQHFASNVTISSASSSGFLPQYTASATSYPSTTTSFASCEIPDNPSRVLNGTPVQTPWLIAPFSHCSPNTLGSNRLRLFPEHSRTISTVFEGN